jgi:outer membrane protein OmpA-like peptidoglycan-associated protein
MTVSFVVDRYNITEVQRPNVEAVANYMEAHPDINVTICGFADVETAYPAHNMKLSKRRATAVYRMLTKQFGVDPRRLSIDYRGDIVQPYRLQNEWNRVVVFKINPNNDYKFLEEK